MERANKDSYKDSDRGVPSAKKDKDAAFSSCALRAGTAGSVLIKAFLAAASAAP